MSYVETLCYHKQSHVPKDNISVKDTFKVEIESFVVFQKEKKRMTEISSELRSNGRENIRNYEHPETLDVGQK